MLMIFSILFDNYKVVGYEVTFLLEKYQNFGPSELNISKKRSNSAAVFTRLAYLDVSMSGLLLHRAEEWKVGGRGLGSRRR